MRLSTITFATTVVVASLCHAAPVLSDTFSTRDLALDDTDSLDGRVDSTELDSFDAREFDDGPTLSARARAGRVGAAAGKKVVITSRGGDPSKRRPAGGRPGAPAGKKITITSRGGDPSKRRPAGRPAGGRPGKAGGRPGKAGARPGNAAGRQGGRQGAAGGRPGKPQGGAGGRPGGKRPAGRPQPGARPRPPQAAPKKSIASKVKNFFKNHYKEVGHALGGAVTSYTNYQQSHGKESRLTPAAAIINGVVSAPANNGAPGAPQ